jgi:hypothetical protein
MEQDERHRLERKMKRAKREAEDLQEEMKKSNDEEEKRRLASAIDELETKARRLKRKLW